MLLEGRKQNFDIIVDKQKCRQQATLSKITPPLTGVTGLS